MSLSSEQKCLTTLTAAVAFVLFIIATFAKLSLGKGKALFVSDGFYYYAYTVSLVLDRDLDFSNQYQFNKGWASFTYAYIVPQTGYPANQYGIGFGLLLLPAFAIAHLGVLAAKAVGLPLTTTGYELYYQLPTYLWSFLLGLLGMGLLYRLLTEVFDWRHAFGATVGILFGTALSNYAFLHANMSHWVSAASATAYLYGVFQVYRHPDQWCRWLIAGLALGVAAMVRYQNAALGVLLAGLLWQLVRQGRWRTLAVGVTIQIAAAIVTFLPQIVAWRTIYGELFTNPYGSYVRWFSPNFSYLLWLLAYSPLLLVALWGFIHPFPRALPKAFVASVGLTILGQLYVNCALPELGGYGVRRMTDFFPYLGIGLANALRVMDRRKGTARSLWLIGVGILVNWLLIGSHYLHQFLSGSGFHF